MSSHAFHPWMLAIVGVIYGGQQLYRWSTGRSLLPLFGKSRQRRDDWDDSGNTASADPRSDDHSCAVDTSTNSFISDSGGSDSGCGNGGGSDSGGSD